MKTFTSLAVALLAVSPVAAHYRFNQINKNGIFKYIRENTSNNSPVTDLASNDLRCNTGAKGDGTETVAVKAGSSFTFDLDQAVYHQGPVAVYMSKAPGAASAYAGDGDWFKIAEEGPTFSGGSSTWPMRASYTYSIPTCIANGDYLLRIEQLAIHNPGSLPQFYISCAQVTVSGGSGGSPSPTTKIPGHVKATDPGYTANIYNNFNSYTIPGPKKITC
ncbi:glycosyl hydrolase family 61-domain-containing protein [Diaporthe sp. PMI_573]|nr:glycosyl hydrolase family 61-domain-containing protein [Diaporthaceae sp. PMI_573]